MSRDWPSKNMLIPTCYRAKFGHSMTNSTSIHSEIQWKNWTPHVPPFKVTQGHWNWHRSIRYLCHTVSKINRDFNQKSQIFYPRLFITTAEGVLLEFCSSAAEKNENDGPSRWQKYRLCNCLDTILQRNGKTDRQKCCINSACWCAKRTAALANLVHVSNFAVLHNTNSSVPTFSFVRHVGISTDMMYVLWKCPKCNLQHNHSRLLGIRRHPNIH